MTVANSPLRKICGAFICLTASAVDGTSAQDVVPGQEDKPTGYVIFENYLPSNQRYSELRRKTLAADYVSKTFNRNFETALTVGGIDLTGAVLGAIEGKVIWETNGMPLTVCFFKPGDGVDDEEARIRVRDLAKQWELPGTYIQFDFGTSWGLNECDGSPYDIRITFEGSGVSSVLGRDSSIGVSHQPSMRLGSFHTKMISDADFKRWVLHEFGHALGFIHEHQGPKANCFVEFNVDLLKETLKSPPYVWEEEKIITNLQNLSLEEPRVNFFDTSSIMLYTFDERFYNKGDESSCYHKPNYEISEGDTQLAMEVFAASAQSQKDLAVERILPELLDVLEKDLMTEAQFLQFLQLNSVRVDQE